MVFVIFLKVNSLKLPHERYQKAYLIMNSFSMMVKNLNIVIFENLNHIWMISYLFCIINVFIALSFYNISSLVHYDYNALY